MNLLISFCLISLASKAESVKGQKGLPYGIHAPYPYGAKDPLESPEIDRTLSMGDTMLTSEQQDSLMKNLDMSGVTKGTERRIFYWPKATIPYHIDCSLTNLPRALAAINLAIFEWEKMTCIKFVKRTTENDYLVFLRDSGCWASQGKIDGPSLISIGFGCEFRNVISHLIGHVVGLWHPQNRIDRNDYIRIFWQNINAVERSAFRTIDDTDGVSGPYDYSSIMHFPWDAFTNTGYRTMLALQRVNGKPYNKISALDALQVSVLYNCQPPKFAKALKKREKRNIPASRNFENGCADRNNRCPEWAAAGLCSTNRYIHANCKSSCHVSCDEKANDSCKDDYQSCPLWARLGYCSKRRLAQGCKRSCGKCMTKNRPLKCKDIGTFCKYRARSGHCSIPWIKMNCRQSCDSRCERRNSPIAATKPKGINCKDKYPFCKRWSELGYCKKVDRVKKICKGSCDENCKIKPTTPRPTTVPMAKKQNIVFNVVTLRASSPIDSGRGWAFGKGVLCMDRNTYCSNLPAIKCETDTWMKENCAGTCKNSNCDNVIYRPADKCADPLGMAFGGKAKLSDAAFNASSYLKIKTWKAAPENARLYLTDNSNKRNIGAWCAADNKKGSWLQVDLGKISKVRYIATQGRDKHYEKVREYMIAYSNDGANFKEYEENGKVKIFDGNCDHFTPVMNKFKNPIVAKFIRIYPTKFNFACLRMELYGC